MKILSAILGVMLMLAGVVVVVAAFLLGPGDPGDNPSNNNGDWSCAADQNTASTECNWGLNSPPETAWETANRDDGVLVGCVLFLGGTVFVGAAVAGAGGPATGRGRSMPRQVMSPDGPPYSGA